MLRLALAAGLAVLVPFVWADTAAARVVFDNAWIRAPAPGQTVAAGYCDIANNGSQPAVITAFTASFPVEMHETAERDGMMRMRPLARLTVPSAATVSLAPGGKHLMLFGFDGEVPAELTLHAVFADGGKQAVTFIVRPLAP